MNDSCDSNGELDVNGGTSNDATRYTAEDPNIEELERGREQDESIVELVTRTDNETGSGEGRARKLFKSPKKVASHTKTGSRQDIMKVA